MKVDKQEWQFDAPLSAGSTSDINHSLQLLKAMCQTLLARVKELEKKQ